MTINKALLALALGLALTACTNKQQAEEAVAEAGEAATDAQVAADAAAASGDAAAADAAQAAADAAAASADAAAANVDAAVAGSGDAADAALGEPGSLPKDPRDGMAGMTRKTGNRSGLTRTVLHKERGDQVGRGNRGFREQAANAGGAAQAAASDGNCKSGFQRVKIILKIGGRWKAGRG